MEAWLQIKGAGAISQDGHEEQWRAMITMAVKDVHLALVQRASGSKGGLRTVSSEFTCKLGTRRRLQLREAAHLQQGQQGVAAGVLRSDVRSQ
jgi:hypothetical protein